MKRGDKCFVCYDGKYGRRVIGTVIKNDRNRLILIEFKSYDDDLGIVKSWFRKHKSDKQFSLSKKPRRGVWETYHNHNEPSIHMSLFGLKGDYYSAFKIKKLKHEEKDSGKN